MKNFTIFTVFALLAVGLLSNSDKSSSANFVFTALEEAPVLPEFPLNYEVDIPLHITSIPDEPTGYETNEPDVALAEGVTNEGATLGRVLFYDKKLSALEDIACASCHLPSSSFADNKDFSQGVNTPTTRNSMHLNDLGWTKNKGFFWDFRSNDFHEAISLPLTDNNEIGANLTDIVTKMESTSYYADLFQDAYGTKAITSEKIIDALVQFIASMNTFNSKFDKGAENDFVNFNDAENRGKDLFAQSCANCHSEGNGIPGFGFSFGSLEETIMFFPTIFNNGLEENSEDIGVGSWLDGMDGLFKSPTLRNIELTGPYMHDGRFETLDEVIDFYSEDPVENEWGSEFIPPGGFQFTENEKSDLIAFLETLTDQTVALNQKWANPFSYRVSTTEPLDIDVKVMPNPMDLYSEIRVDNSAGARIDVSIADNTGKILRTDYFTGNSYTIEKADFVSGLYFVSLTQDNKLATYKLIVQ